MMEPRQTFSIALLCFNCGNDGTALWEEAGRFDRARGAERRLLSLTGKFHAESGRTNSGDPVIVCNECDEILPD